MLGSGEYSAAEIGDLFGVARSTVYRALARSKAAAARERNSTGDSQARSNTQISRQAPILAGWYLAADVRAGGVVFALAATMIGVTACSRSGAVPACGTRRRRAEVT